MTIFPILFSGQSIATKKWKRATQVPSRFYALFSGRSIATTEAKYKVAAIQKVSMPFLAGGLLQQKKF